uniref:Uncharacterized protein n=1 Tax=Anguilla anguilla TaxID=7936 RepID=A0A0E9XTD2_ANGAN
MLASTRRSKNKQRQVREVWLTGVRIPRSWCTARCKWSRKRNAQKSRSRTRRWSTVR